MGGWIPLREKNREAYEEVQQARLIVRNLAFRLEQGKGGYTFAYPKQVAALLRLTDEKLKHSQQAMEEEDDAQG